MTLLSRTKLNELLNQTNGKIFTATFQKKDGTWGETSTAAKVFTSSLRVELT